MNFTFNPSLWFVCKLCRQPFPDTNTLKQHKLQYHFQDCIKIKCIVFEEKLLDHEWFPPHPTQHSNFNPYYGKPLPQQQQPPPPDGNFNLNVNSQLNYPPRFPFHPQNQNHNPSPHVGPSPSLSQMLSMPPEIDLTNRNNPMMMEPICNPSTSSTSNSNGGKQILTNPAPPAFPREDYEALPHPSKQSRVDIEELSSCKFQDKPTNECTNESSTPSSTSQQLKVTVKAEPLSPSSSPPPSSIYNRAAVSDTHNSYNNSNHSNNNSSNTQPPLHLEYDRQLSPQRSNGSSNSSTSPDTARKNHFMSMLSVMPNNGHHGQRPPTGSTQNFNHRPPQFPGQVLNQNSHQNASSNLSINHILNQRTSQMANQASVQRSRPPKPPSGYAPPPSQGHKGQLGMGIDIDLPKQLEIIPTIWDTDIIPTNRGQSDLHKPKSGVSKTTQFRRPKNLDNFENLEADSSGFMSDKETDFFPTSFLQQSLTIANSQELSVSPIMLPSTPTMSYTFHKNNQGLLNPMYNGKPLGNRKIPPLQCDLCPERFFKKNVLLNHMKEHSIERPFKCKDCPSAFKDSGTLRRHQIVHGRVTRHKCNFCGKFFNFRNVLQDHERTHTGDRPFKCELPNCDYAFSSKTALNMHAKRMHSEELGLEQFDCVVCGKTFGLQSELHKHIQVNHREDKPFMCPQENCRKSYKSKRQLLKHILGHTLSYQMDVKTEMVEASEEGDSNSVEETFPGYSGGNAALEMFPRSAGEMFLGSLGEMLAGSSRSMLPESVRETLPGSSGETLPGSRRETLPVAAREILADSAGETFSESETSRETLPRRSIGETSSFSVPISESISVLVPVSTSDDSTSFPVPDSVPTSIPVSISSSALASASNLDSTPSSVPPSVTTTTLITNLERVSSVPVVSVPASVPASVPVSTPEQVSQPVSVAESMSVPWAEREVNPSSVPVPVPVSVPLLEEQSSCRPVGEISNMEGIH